MNQPSSQRVLTVANAPIFFSFFLWGFGTGAQHLARPLFAYALTGDVFLVALLISVNAMPRVFVGPITGILADRFGRKPLSIAGAGLRGVTNIAQAFSGDYVTFLALEFTGQIGVSMWGTSSNVLVADMTNRSNRARVIAVRGMCRRSGFVAGPLIGGVLAAAFGLESLFVLNGVSKFVIVFVVVSMVAETRPRRTPSPEPGPSAGRSDAAPRPASRPALSAFKTPSFVALAIVVIGMSITQTAVIQTLLPLHAQEVVGLDESRVGFVLSLVAVSGFLMAFPSGMLADRFGRKMTLVPGLLLMSLASVMLAASDAYGLLLLVVVDQRRGRYDDDEHVVRLRDGLGAARGARSVSRRRAVVPGRWSGRRTRARRWPVPCRGPCRRVRDAGGPARDRRRRHGVARPRDRRVPLPGRRLRCARSRPPDEER